MLKCIMCYIIMLSYVATTEIVSNYTKCAGVQCMNEAYFFSHTVHQVRVKWRNLFFFFFAHRRGRVKLMPASSLRYVCFYFFLS